MEVEKSLTYYEEMLSRCKKIGISVSELSRQSGVKRQVFANWKKKDPKSLQQFKTIEYTLEKLEAEKLAHFRDEYESKNGGGNGSEC